ncbi:MAG: ABC transporter, permease protein 1 (cluster 5, nickel/peptides/opines) [uncultured Thermomicrobiales bacterium]|uniref:ABC transporter, permease protein 1 (Cluster 5, nickel/peptides/opines) n=1 Tax=uncultured Thermomicrobiales bacterium TaxID=1645740 RepID=A0A6J4UPI2_9BACT|nr:MAG: ABC transporter, permease protein 1 (cluster 5, nickel/peptides/opines) [uncultured Thermomicrobiales bacterium]
MVQYIGRRVLLMIPTLFAISIVSFIIIQLPPGDFLTTLVSQLSSQGESVNQEALNALRSQYGLGEPVYVQYYLWIKNILLHGDFGDSFEYNRPVRDLLGSRLAWTVGISLASLLITWLVAFPVGIYSAVRKYTPGDYALTFVSFLGLAIPEFMLALVLLYVSSEYLGLSVGGLFSPQYQDAAWSLAKFGDLLAHLWIPVIIIGVASTAGLVRIMRANLLDELNRPYVVTARAKGLEERKLLLKYPVRLALNPFISTLGWALPGIISGEAIVAIVLSLPTIGPLLLRALQSQDMYLAGSLILILSVLTVIGTLISDILLAWLDPRIRYM